MPHSDPGHVAINNVDGDIADDVAISGTVDPPPDTYSISYRISDTSGNAANRTWSGSDVHFNISGNILNQNLGMT